jgi:hypothetical protein
MALRANIMKHFMGITYEVGYEVGLGAFTKHASMLNAASVAYFIMA